MLALPSCIGGLQTGCATDGKTIFTNGIDAIRLMSQETMAASGVPPTGGRVVAISLDTRTERWRHERPRVASLGGPPPKPVFTDVGDPVASGIAVANGVVYFTDGRQRQARRPRRRRPARVLKEIDARPRLVGALRLPRPRLRRHGQYPVHPVRRRGVLPQEDSPACSTPSACPARTKSIGWRGEGSEKSNRAYRGRGRCGADPPYGRRSLPESEG